MNNFSSTAAIVIALTSPMITALALTRQSKAKPILHALARELTPKDGVYENTLQQAMTNDLVPWLGIVYPLRSSVLLPSYLLIRLLQTPSFPPSIRLLPTAISSLKCPGIL
jgi:hypothetical protein